MERHKHQHSTTSDAEGDQHEDEEPGDEDSAVVHRPDLRRRRSSDPSSNRPVVRHRRRHRSDSDSDSDSDVEDLPDRFDTRGSRLDGGPDPGRARTTTRRGTFERPPQHAGDWDVRGAWQASGTDGEMVDRLVRDVTGVLEGRQSWMAVLGDVLGGGAQGQIGDEDGDAGRRGRRRR